MVKDLGKQQAQGVGGLLRLAECSEHNAERDTRAVLVDHFGLSLPIPIRTRTVEAGTDKGKPFKLPMLHLTDWANYLLESNSWHLLAGLCRPDRLREEKIWQAWWDNYRAIDPTHVAFEMEARGELQLSRTAAMVLHGDEGRGRRRQAFLVVSYKSMLGRGSHPAQRAAKRKAVKKPYIKHETNMLGHTLTTHFLAGVLPRNKYGEDDCIFDALLTGAAEQAKEMCTTGVMDREGRKFNMFVLRTIGDWPWLAKSGKLCQTFANAVKKEQQAANEMCHLCCAGPDMCPFEEIATKRPRWASTVGLQEPFYSTPAMAIVPHTPGRLAEHYTFDIFHTIHLGVGRNFLGSALALLSEREPARGVDERFNTLTEKYLAWCKASSHPPVTHKLTKDLIQWPATTDYPSGGWYKAELTTTLLEWFETLDGSFDEDDEVMSLAMEACKALNGFVRLLFRSGAWLSAEDAGLAAQLALKYLRRYSQLAGWAQREDRTLWILQPKVHCLHHIALTLWEHSQAGKKSLNPVCCSTQTSEDFIGKPSRLSRRVAAQTVIQRVLERHLQNSYAEWVKAGLLVETLHRKTKLKCDCTMRFRVAPTSSDIEIRAVPK